VDESGFYLLPGVVRTYSVRGNTPLLRVFETYQHLSAIAGISPKGDLYTMVRSRSINGIKCVAFLKHLLHFVSDRLVVIWDGSPIHRSDDVKLFLQTRRARKLELVRLPGYAPDMNPAEGLWQHLKHVEMRNICCGNFIQLRYELNLAILRTRARPWLVQSFFGQAGLDIQDL